MGDFSLSQGARVDTNFVPLGEYPGDFWHYARNKVIVAARIAGIDAIDAPYPDYKDTQGYERDARPRVAARLHRQMGDPSRPGADRQ